MKQQEIVKKIGVILKELQEQYQFIEQTQEPVNDLELELFVANGHFLTDHIEILRKVNEQAIKAQTVKQTVKKSTITEKFFEPVIQPVRVAPEKKETSVEYIEFEPADAPVVHEDEPQAETGTRFESEVRPVAEQQPEPEPPAFVPAVEEFIAEAPAAEEAIAEKPIAETPANEPATEPIIRHELVLDDKIAYADEEEDDKEKTSNDEIAVVDHDDAFKKIAERFNIPYFTFAEPKPVANLPEPEIPVQPEPEIPAPVQPTPEIPAPLKPEIPAPAKPEPKPEIPISVKPEPQVTSRAAADLDKPPLTLNEILSAQRANASRLSEQLPPIKDLRAAINLNDKMLYVKDLFNGYSLSYSEAIELLNRMDSFDEADRFLKTNYAVKNGWDEKQATADRFYALLRRRFA